MVNLFDYLEIPEFSEFIINPNNSECRVIDYKRIIVEVLGGHYSISREFGQSTFFRKMILDGSHALVIRYKRESDGLYRIACGIGFYGLEDSVHIVQIQGSNDDSVAFRFMSSFDISGFVLRLVENSFIRNGIPVVLQEPILGLDKCASSSKAKDRYHQLYSALEQIKSK